MSSPFDEHIVPVISAGGSCLICDDPIMKGMPVLRVQFKLSLLVVSKMISGELHAHCAGSLGSDMVAKATRLLRKA
jgi:hypothetical protein